MFPTILDTQYFLLHTLWIFIVASLILTVYVTIKLSLLHGLKIQFLSENFWQFAIWAFIGGRILGIIENYSVYFSEFSVNSLPRLFYVWDKGFNLWGIIIGFFISFYFICKREDQNFWRWLDVLVPAIIAGLAIKNIGNFFDGINYGNETNLPWGVNFERPAIKYTVPIHPTQIYSFLYTSAICIGLILISNIKRVKASSHVGLIGLGGVFIFGLLNFLEQFLRGDDVIMLLGIRVPQISALILTLISGIFFYLRYNKQWLFSESPTTKGAKRKNLTRKKNGIS